MGSAEFLDTTGEPYFPGRQEQTIRDAKHLSAADIVHTVLDAVRPASPTLSENRPAIRLVEREPDSRVDRRRALAFEPLPSCLPLPPNFAARP